MNSVNEIANSHATIGDVSAMVSGAGVVVSFMTKAMPELQFIAVIVSIVTGMFASVYYVKKINRIDRDNHKGDE
jgi:hypothetical protein